MLPLLYSVYFFDEWCKENAAFWFKKPLPDVNLRGVKPFGFFFTKQI
jgi:hypothetical protein